MYNILYKFVNITHKYTHITINVIYLKLYIYTIIKRDDDFITYFPKIKFKFYLIM